ncbi:MAG: M1 family metallopeptidase [Flavobacteriales bacterium]
MRISFLFLFLFLFGVLHFTQAQYWQQQVDYRISVKLDDKTHRLYGDIAFDYINNAPTSLDSLYIHVWPNAYQPTKSALANQLANGGKNLSIIDTAKWGGISALAFTINGAPVTWNFDPSHRDIVHIKLPKPLGSGEKLTVSTPFVVKIPSGSISRLGHIGQSYQITQWYPKPAVYDHKGWHPIPYLNQGEFYSEFGSFDVSITLPKNYVLNATGDLQTVSEQQFLNTLAEETKANMENILALPPGNIRDSFPPSSNEWKTVRFTQDNVHDFAWFADKRYQVLKGKVSLPHSGREVTTWALFTPANAALWKDAIQYINDGTFYYSKWNGDYPYSAVTAVDGTISAGGGMEYPMITVIGNASSPLELEIVIVHEVGHNWFYGILGSNERQHGWMDEGMNTANEMRYVATKYPNNQQMSDMVLGGKLHLNDLDHHDMGDISYRTLAMIGADQPIETHSADFSSTNYGMIMYQKTGLVFQYLRAYLGDNLYDQCMQRYYELFQFKHPYPEDMKRVLEAVSARNLDWLFEDLIKTTRTMDYHLSKAKWIEAVNVYNVKVKNRSSVKGPIAVSSLAADGRALETQWTNPKDKKSTLFFNGDKSIVSFAIDPDRNIPEINRTNNLCRVDRLIGRKQEPLSVEFGFGDNEWGTRKVFWLPMMAFNHSDRAMLGVAVHNFGIPFNPIQYFIAPMYSFGRNRPGGVAEIGKTFFPGKGLGPMKLGISVKSFGIDDDPKSANQSYYLAATPYLRMNLQSTRRKKGVLHELLFKGLARQDEFLNERTREWGG